MKSRVNITASCKDCFNIPKVHNAGEISGMYQIMHNGIKVVRGGYHGDWMEEIIRRLKGHHEPQEEKAFHEILHEIPAGGSMLELGCNWAYYSMWFNKVVQKPTNIMIEPSLAKLEVGKRNFAANNMNGFFANAFVGQSSSKSAKFKDWDGIEYKMHRTCVDDVRERFNLNTIDIVHSDIQGAEYEMLLGASQSIEKGRIRIFVISTHGIDKHKMCLHLLQKSGYNIRCSHTESESYSADGLIVASIHTGPVIYISKR